ncbi:MAG: hypothetical protein ACREH6_12100 [Geminicoccaceae bacterium]
MTREMGDRRGEGQAFRNLGLVHAALGERGQATGRMHEALAIFEQMGAEHLAEKARDELSEWEDKSGG